MHGQIHAQGSKALDFRLSVQRQRSERVLMAVQLAKYPNWAPTSAYKNIDNIWSQPTTIDQELVHLSGPKEVLGFLRRPNEWWTLVVAYGLRKHNASLAQLSINALIVWWKRSQ